MQFFVNQRPIHVFAISPRTREVDKYWSDIVRVAESTQRHGFTGILLFTGNDVYVEPWVAAQALLAQYPHITLLVAVNPIYMHPFAVSKIVMSLSRLYGRQLFLNLITGTALNYLRNLGDQLSHDERYERLLEYGYIIRQLLAAPIPVTVSGRFYQVTETQMLPGLPCELQPKFLLAGQSPAAQRVASHLGAIGTQMVSPNLSCTDATRSSGVYCGIVTRPLSQDAWRVAHEIFPEWEVGKEILELSMANTDSSWKERLRISADATTEPNSPYWLNPFRNFQADCPYLVGSHTEVAEVITSLVTRGIDTFIVDIPATEEEFAHVHAVFDVAAQLSNAARQVSEYEHREGQSPAAQRSNN